MKGLNCFLLFYSDTEKELNDWEEQYNNEGIQTTPRTHKIQKILQVVPSSDVEASPELTVLDNSNLVSAFPTSSAQPYRIVTIIFIPID